MYQFCKHLQGIYDEHSFSNYKNVIFLKTFTGILDYLIPTRTDILNVRDFLIWNDFRECGCKPNILCWLIRHKNLSQIFLGKGHTKKFFRCGKWRKKLVGCNSY